jgi:MFS family permease
LAASAILGAMATVSLLGRGLTAALGERFTTRQYIMIGYGLRTLGLVIFIYARTIPLIMLFVLIYGIGYGITIPAQTALRADYFGRKAYATITGIITMFTAVTNIAYPIFAGWIYDTSGSYLFAFSTITALQAFAVVFMYLGKKPTPPTNFITPVY